ncbi:hypothetical protein ACE193_19340 [Bernardetia sp. OM2101]|uniref:hypothetical protein n=1 Tax=Bernardetia sp. OM2101 TaxID=3344876 RepID=UPI0035CFE01B
MKNNSTSFKLYFISAFLWLGVAFFAYFIFDVNKRELDNTEQNIIESAQKLEKKHQNLFAINEKWWERKSARDISFATTNPRDREIIKFLKNSNYVISFYKNSNKVILNDIKDSFSNDILFLNKFFTEQINQLISNEELYLKSNFTSTLYKNALLQKFRKERISVRVRFFESCGFDKLFSKLTIIDENRIGIQGDKSRFALKNVVYKKYPFTISQMDKKDFEFEISIKRLGRNQTKITKKYRTLPKEGQELKPFDYEEIE